MSSTFTAEHVAHLRGSAVDPAFAAAAHAHSVRTRDDLDPNLRYIDDEQVKGIQFGLTRPDGTVVPQHRPDNPGTGPKYIQAAGTGSVFVVHPSHVDRIGKATKVLCQEGTKQYLAVAKCAPLDTLVVGMQGSSNFSSNGVPLGGLDELVRNAETVTISFDADVATNRSVYDGAKVLADHIAAVSDADVKFLVSPTRGTAGIDDWLAERDEGDRAAAVARLIKAAKKLPGKAPAAKKLAAVRASGTPISDMHTGTIREADQTFAGVTTPGRVIAHFAAVIVESFTVADDLAGGSKSEQYRGIEHTLLIATGTAGTPDRREWYVEGVLDENLGKVAWWLARASVTCTKLWYESAYGYLETIKGAIRAASADGLERLRFTRTGIVDLPEVGAVYLHGGGAIGATGETRAAMASLSGDLSSITYPNPAEMTAEEIRADVACDFEVLDLLNDPTPWLVLEAIRCFALSGAVNDNDKARIGIFLDGPPASGKTTVLRTYACAYGQRFFGNAMHSAHDTNLALASAGIGLQDGVIIVDDLLKRSDIADPMFLRDQMKAIDLLSRVSHSGGSERRGRMAKSDRAGESFVREAPNSASPVIIMAGEERVPERSYSSTVQRLFNVSVTKATTMKDDGGVSTARMKEIGASGSRSRSTAAFLRWQMNLINDHGGLDSHRIMLKENRANLEAYIAETVLELETNRSREQLAALYLGVETWLAFGESVGAITEERADEIEADAQRLLVAAAVKNLTENVGSVRKHAQGTLEALRSLVAAGKATTDHTSALASVPTIGKRTDWNGIQYMALNPVAVAGVLGLRSHTDRDLGAARAVSALQDLYIPHSEKQVLHKVRLSSDPTVSGVGCIMIPIASWDGADDDWDENDITTAVTPLRAIDPFDADAVLAGRDEYGNWLHSAA